MDVSKILDCNSVEEQDLVSQYVGRKLSSEEAEAFEEHYFGCDRCWAEVQAATELRAALQEQGSRGRESVPEPVQSRVIRGPWRNWGLLAAAAVAIVAVAAALLVSKGASRSRDPGTLVADLAEAVGQRHSIRARLTGGFRYPEVSRSAGAPAKAPSWKVFADAEKIKQAAERNVTAESARALGLAHLFVGETDQAVGRLQEGALLAPKDARIHSDLSAAYLVLAEQKDRPDAFVRALSEAETAIGIDPNLVEAHFNRALALESMSLKEKARKAWEEYLRLDSRSEWAGEARRHLETLAAPRASRSWEEEEKRLDKAIESGNSVVIQEVLKSFPQQSRELFEQKLLPEWAEASSARPRSDSVGLLRNLEVFAREQSRATRDRMLPDITEAILKVLESGDATALARLTRGLTAYGRGKDLIDRLESQKAHLEFDESRQDLRQSGNPLSGWADFYRAICLYYEDDFEGSRVECERLRVFAEEKGYGNLLGRTAWMTGLIHLVRGEVDQAVADYSSALKSFNATGEKGHVAAVESLIATGLSYLGDSKASWRHRLASLNGSEDLHDLRRVHRLYSNAADAAMVERLPLVALSFQDEALTTAPSWKSALILMEAHLYRASILGNLGRQKETAEELDRARQSLADIDDETIKVGESAALDAAAGELEIGSRPEEAEKILGRALDYFRHTKHSVRVPQVYLARGRAFLKSGDPDRAETDFNRGIEELERQRELQGQFRASFFDASRDLFSELIELEALGRDHPDIALAYAERFRTHDDPASWSRGPGGKGQPQAGKKNGLETASIRSQLPPATALLYFASLNDRLFSWLVTRDGVRFSQKEIGSGELVRRVAIFRSALETRASDREIRRWGSQFYEDLLRPQIAALPTSTTLVIIPDGALEDLPFAGLYDQRSRRYVIEDRGVALAPSAAAFLRARQRRIDDSAEHDLTAIAVGNPQFDQKAFPGLASLPYAETEARSVASVYPGSELLLGKAATRRDLLSAATRHAVIHFAGHALTNSEYPEFSRLVLAPQDSRDSGSLFARDIPQQDLSRVSLVVLAACRSAQAARSQSEGPLNLVRPFLAAGVPNVLGTLWDIDDRSSSAFFVRFHTLLRSGKGPLDALREAQLANLRSSDESVRSPANWAAFVLFGSPGRIERRS
jgi:CHAT domain-containing protein/Tfp pilus assembly protein PilF